MREPTSLIDAVAEIDDVFEPNNTRYTSPVSALLAVIILRKRELGEVYYKLPRPNIKTKLILFLVFAFSPRSCGTGKSKTMMSRAMLTPPVA
jgi:hypothetical protein